MLALLAIVQWLHILCGIIWLGGYVFMDAVMWPALLRLPAAQAQAAAKSLDTFAGPLMAISGTLVILLGLVLGTVLGPIRSLSEAFTNAYGITWLVALLVALFLTVWGANWHARWLGPVWVDDVIRPGAVSRLRLGIAVEMFGFGLILVCMVLLGVVM
jgi:uncharacterized membrane protein